MRLFICGGGSGKQTVLVNKKFDEVLNNDKRPLLYIPFAMTKIPFESCYEWIKGELENVQLSSIEMVKTVDELENKNFEDYCAIFIGGGNTYLLLSLLKSNSSFEKIKQYALNDGIIFGSSAGAVFCGNDIDTIKLMDPNDVDLLDTTGLNILNDYSIYPHYTNKSVEFEENATEHLLSFGKKTFAIPEETTLYFTDNGIEVLGSQEVYVFENGSRFRYRGRM